MCLLSQRCGYFAGAYMGSFFRLLGGVIYPLIHSLWTTNGGGVDICGKLPLTNVSTPVPPLIHKGFVGARYPQPLWIVNRTPVRQVTFVTASTPVVIHTLWKSPPQTLIPP